jgi:hypothetical protein
MTCLSPRRGITLIETSVACAVGSLLVYLVAMSWCGFTRGAHLMVARVELMREADLAIARLSDSLRGGDAPWIDAVDGALVIGTGQDPDRYVAADHLLRRNGQVLAHHVEWIELSPDQRTIRLHMHMPDVVEDPDRAHHGANARWLERDVYLMLAQP